jgi:PPIC-type PPIASE domain
MIKIIVMIISALAIFSPACAQKNIARMGKTSINQDHFNAVLNFKGAMGDEIEKESFRAEITKVVQEYLAGTILIDRVLESNPEMIRQADLFAKSRYRFMVASQLEGELTMVYAEDLPKMRSPELDELVFKSLETQTIPEKRAKWAHIYIPFNGEKQQEEVLIEVQEIQAKLKEGSSFEDLIEEYSQESDVSRDQTFGPMEYHGKVLPIMAKTIDGLNKNEISEPVETEIGYFIFKLHYRSVPKQQMEDNTRVGIYRELMAKKQREKAEALLADLRSKYKVTFGSSEDDFYMKVEDHVVYAEDLEWYIKEGNDLNRPFKYASITDERLKMRVEKQELLVAYQMEVGKIPSDAMEMLEFMIQYEERRKVALPVLVSIPEVTEEEIENEFQENPPTPVIGVQGLLFSINDLVLYEQLKSRTAKNHIEYITEFFNLNRSFLASKPSELPPSFKPYTIENFNIGNISLLSADLKKVFQETEVFSAAPPMRGKDCWNIFFVYEKKETKPSVESVSPALREKIVLKKRRMAEEEYIQQIINNNNFEMLVSFDDLMYSREANGFVPKK